MKTLLLLCCIAVISCNQKPSYPDPHENEKTYIIADKDTIVFTGHIIKTDFSKSRYNSSWTDLKNGDEYCRFERAVSSKYPDK